MSVVLDASAVLAAMLHEPGADIVERYLADEVVISSVNAAEVVAKLIDKGADPDAAVLAFSTLMLPVQAFGAAQGLEAGRLRGITRSAGLSLGDRACLAEARLAGTVAVTADRAWGDLDIGIEIEVIR